MSKNFCMSYVDMLKETTISVNNPHRETHKNFLTGPLVIHCQILNKYLGVSLRRTLVSPGTVLCGEGRSSAS